MSGMDVLANRNDNGNGSDDAASSSSAVVFRLHSVGSDVLLRGLDRRGKPFRAVCPNYPSAAGMTLNDVQMDADDSKGKTADEVIDNIGKEVEAEERPSLNSASLSVLEEISGRVGWDNVVSLSDDLSSVVLTNCKRQITVNIPKDYPKCPLVCRTEDLPDDLDVPTGANLTQVYERFETAVTALSPVWEKLAELDAEACVVDPDRPTGKDLYRRVAVTRDVSVQVTLDPREPDACPNLLFLGADAEVAGMRAAYADEYDGYDPDMNMKRSLERLLGGVELPGPEAKADDDFLVDCCVCYAYHLGDANEIPSKTCDGGGGTGTKGCGQKFHERCLYSYLLSAPDKQIFLNMIAGKCLVCGSRITCKNLAM